MAAQLAEILPPDVRLTPSAAQKIHTLIVEEGELDLMLRIHIEGGGCSGFQYAFTFDPNMQEGDLVLRESVQGGSAQVGVVIDCMSHDYLQGATIDYVEDVQGERFVIHNPQVKSTCGCGASFTLEG